MIFSKRTALMVAAPAVASMFTVAFIETQRGTPTAEVHLITAAPVTVGTSITTSSLDFVIYNAITEAHYLHPPTTRPLKLDRMTIPRDFIDPTA
jgi:hypothetical protein